MGVKHVTQGAVRIQRVGSVCKTETDIPVLLNLGGSCTAVLLRSFNDYFFPTGIMTRNIKYS